MSPFEVMGMVRMLVDDGMDWFSNLSVVEYAVNEAQMRIVQKYHTMDDERALRTLYREATATTNPFQIEDGLLMPNGNTYYAPLLYPKACRLYEGIIFSEDNSSTAQYYEPELYFNYNNPGYNIDQIFPRSAEYTIEKKYSQLTNEYETWLHFTPNTINTDDPTAYLKYIKRPHTFTSVSFLYGYEHGLELPDEYHIEVCALAAEILNDIDVGEMERGEIAFQNQRLTIERTGAISG